VTTQRGAPSPALISIDLGTTRLKVAAFDAGGALLAQEAVRNREHRDDALAWQDPNEWWEDSCELLQRLLARPEFERREVAGLSLSGRGGAGIFVDRGGDLLSPSWSDRRHSSQLAALAEWRSGGAQLSNYGMALIAKLTWLREHDAEAAERVAHAMYAKDFLLFRLTGATVTDPTSGPDTADWDDDVLAHAGVDRAVLPSVAMPWALAGEVTAEAAQQSGVPAGTPVAVGAHDGICANVGAGAGAVGSVAITVGTHAVVRAVMAEQPTGAYRFYGMPPDREIIGGNAVMAGRGADWFVDGWLAHTSLEQRAETFATLDAEAADVPAGAGGVLFLPFLQGQVAPEARPDAAAAFAGLRGDHDRAEMYRAVLEGGAFAIRGIFEQVRGWCGDPARVRFTGSGARSAVWRQIIVDALRWPVEATDAAAEGRGAAIYLATALGYHPDVDAAEAAMVPAAFPIEPHGETADVYDSVYARWSRLSEAMRPLDEEMSVTR
jgi:sugar (pentulose or hexulose) kinase